MGCLYGWRRQALAQAVVPAAPQPGAGAPLSGAAKLAAIIETAEVVKSQRTLR